MNEEPNVETEPVLLQVLAELREREPIFHRPELGVGKEDLLRQTAPDFWEIGASGRRYSREHVTATLLERFSRSHDDPWETSEFHCRRLCPDTYLLTYTLRQLDRVTRRATIWRRESDAGGWQVVFHQGTLVAE